MFAFLQKRLLIFYQLKTNDDIDVCYTGLRRPRRILLIAKSFAIVSFQVALRLLSTVLLGKPNLMRVLSFQDLDARIIFAFLQKTTNVMCLVK